MTLKTGQCLRAAAGSYIILLDPPPEKTEGGLHLPDSARGDDNANPFRQFAKVLAVGNQFTDKHGIVQIAEFRVNDRIIVMPGSQIPLPHPSRRLAVVSFTAVLAQTGAELFVDGINTCSIPEIA